jgi:hypothetical protein
MRRFALLFAGRGMSFRTPSLVRAKGLPFPAAPQGTSPSIHHAGPF